MKAIISFLVALTLFSAAPAQVYTKRLALVIGNSDYQNGGSLPNPVNDANSIAQTLQNLGFEVMKYQNVTQKEMKMAINSFGTKLKGYEVGLFYYAGHGIQNKGMNYMIPVEADLQSEEQVEFDCVAADRVLAYMDAAQAKVNVIIMDACRNNPFERSWHRSATGNGLAMMNAPTGSLIAYATAPGRVASDGSGSNGLYTSALLKHLSDPKLSIEQVFKKVRTEVTEKSGGAQVPWETTSLTGDDFYFATNNVAKGTISTQQNIASNTSTVNKNESKRTFGDVSDELKQRAKEKMEEGHNYYTENPDRAIQLYTEAISINPNYDEAYYWRASKKYSLKNYSDAILDYTKAVELNPLYDEAFYYRALSKYNLKQFESSIPDFDKAIEINPDVASMHYWRGETMYSLNRYQEGVTDFTASININKNDGYAYAGRANCFYMLKKYAEARLDYNKAVELMPDKASDYWYWRAISSYNADFPQESYNDFQLYLTKNPKDSYALLMSGHCQYVLKDYNRAIEFYDKAIREKADYKEAYYWRANAYHSLGKMSEATRDVNKALELDPQNETYKKFKQDKLSGAASSVTSSQTTTTQTTTTQNNYADNSGVSTENKSKSDLYLKLGKASFDAVKSEKAVEELTKSIQFNPSNADAYFWRGSSYHDLKQYENAIMDYSKAIELNPQMIEAYYWRGNANYSAKRDPEAISDFSKAISLKPNYPEAYFYRGKVHYTIQADNKALADFTQAIALRSNYADAYLWRGITKYAGKLDEDAILDLNQAIAFNPKLSDAFYYRGLCHYSMKRYPEAIKNLTSCIELKPTSDAYYWRGLSYYSQQNYNDAIVELTSAIDLNPSGASVYLYYYWRGQSFYALKLDQDCINDLDKSIQLKADQPEAWYYRGCSKFYLGRKVEALGDINQAISLDPSNTKYTNFKATNFK